MKAGEHTWDTEQELRTRCERTLVLPFDGPTFFTAGRSPIATATLSPDGKTLDIVIRKDRFLSLLPNTLLSGLSAPTGVERRDKQ